MKENVKSIKNEVRDVNVGNCHFECTILPTESYSMKTTILAIPMQAREIPQSCISSNLANAELGDFSGMLSTDLL